MHNTRIRMQSTRMHKTRRLITYNRSINSRLGKPSSSPEPCKLQSQLISGLAASWYLQKDNDKTREFAGQQERGESALIDQDISWYRHQSAETGALLRAHIHPTNPVSAQLRASAEVSVVCGMCFSQCRLP